MEKMTHQKIKERRLELGLTLKDVAQILGVAESTISRYETSDIQNMGIDKIELLAKALKISPVELMGWEEDAPIDYSKYGLQKVTKRTIPLLGSVACGEPILTDTIEYSFVDGTEVPDADFALIAKGDSMINARIFDGDLVFVKKQPVVDNGELAVVAIDDEATLKRVYYDAEHETMTLMAENPAYAPMIYSGEQLSEVRIVGKPLYFQSIIK